MDCTYVLQLFIRESSLEYYSESVCQPQRMCSMALKNPPIFKCKNLRNVNCTLCFDFNILVWQSAITFEPKEISKNQKHFWSAPFHYQQLLLSEKKRGGILYVTFATNLTARCDVALLLLVALRGVR